MRKFTVEEARARFGDLVDQIKLGAPFGEEDDGSFVIVQDGEPVGLVLARESLLQVWEQQDDWMRAAIAEGEAAIAAGDCVEFDTEEDLHAFFERIKEEGRERLAAKEERACRGAAE